MSIKFCEGLTSPDPDRYAAPGNVVRRIIGSNDLDDSQDATHTKEEADSEDDDQCHFLSQADVESEEEYHRQHADYEVLDHTDSSSNHDESSLIDGAVFSLVQKEPCRVDLHPVCVERPIGEEDADDAAEPKACDGENRDVDCPQEWSRHMRGQSSVEEKNGDLRRRRRCRIENLYHQSDLQRSV